MHAMTRMLRSPLAAVALAALAPTAALCAQEDPSAPPRIQAETGPIWSVGASLYSYHVPGDDDYLQPTVMLDRDWLHFEARYNYEDLDTASLWLGWNLAFGDEVAVEITPMLGGVFGETDGLAPGYRGSIGWWRLELASEGEYLFDADDSSDSFFYTWSELTISPADWLRLGVAVQRTKVYETDFDIQRGFVIGAAIENFDFSAYVFNPDESEPTVVLGMGISF